MSRRKEYTPQQLKELILSNAERIIARHGRTGLTARALAETIHYSPGTIYNVYEDMDALMVDVNYETLGRLQAYCQQKIATLPADFSRVRGLAYAYADFARENLRAWEAIYAPSRKMEHDNAPALPEYYQQRLADIFLMVENTLIDCLKLPQPTTSSSARLLWACLHGITVLNLNGTLGLVGVEQPHAMIDDLLTQYLARYL